MNRILPMGTVNHLDKLQKGKEASVQPMAVPFPTANPQSSDLKKVPAALQLVYFAGQGNDPVSKAGKTQAVAPTTFESQNEVLNWSQYLDKIKQNPKVIATAYQRVYNMIMSMPKHDTGRRDRNGNKIYDYEFFRKNPYTKKFIEGQTDTLHEFVQFVKSAAYGGEQRNRILALVGPVGTSKSLLLDILKQSLEGYAQTEEGAAYQLRWNLPQEVAENPDIKVAKSTDSLGNEGYFVNDPLHDDPLKVFPEGKARDAILGELNTFVQKEYNPKASEGNKIPYSLDVIGGLSPVSALIEEKLKEHYLRKAKEEGATLTDAQLQEKVLSHVEAKRVIFSEKNNVGIAMYTPRDEKNQDSTELSGGVKYSRVLEYGDESHPFAKAYNGKFLYANRGLLDMAEYLKLQVEFLYDMLFLTQEKKVIPKDSPAIDIDTVLVGHTNMPEYERLISNRLMEALRDRTEVIKMPYITEYGQEAKIYEKFFKGRAEKQGLEFAPYSFEIPALTAVMSRLVEGNPLAKAKLYNGDDPADDKVAEAKALKKKADPTEGMGGISPRTLLNVYSMSLVHSDVEENKLITPDLLLRMLRTKLLTDENLNVAERRDELLGLTQIAERELLSRIENDMMKAFLEDSTLLNRYFDKYMQNLKLWEKRDTRDQADRNFLNKVETLMKSSIRQDEAEEVRRQILLKASSIESYTGRPIGLDDFKQDKNLMNALASVVHMNRRDEFQVMDQDQRQQMVKSLNKYGYSERAANWAIDYFMRESGLATKLG